MAYGILLVLDLSPKVRNLRPAGFASLEEGTSKADPSPKIVG